jgi:4-carboxymuconolactone decarboxylase
MSVEIRLPYLNPTELSPEQSAFYDLHLESMKTMPYIWTLPNGALNGPSNLLIHDVEVGNMLFPLNRAIIANSIKDVGRIVHEVAVLVTVSAAKAHYGMYAHTKLAQEAGLSDDKITTITAGLRPDNLTKEEGAAYDLAYSLCQSGAISGMVYDNAVTCFGNKGCAALVLAVGMFKMIGTILNAYNEPVPDYRS